MSFKTDLHIHSWYSDGVLSPAEIAEKYSRDGYDLIAITDHEVTKGIREAEEAGKEKNLRVIPGIELPTLYRGRELHILGYYFDPEAPSLAAAMEKLALSRKNRNKKMLEQLRLMGYDITEEDLIQREGQNYIGKPNFARALIKKGYISSVPEAFEPGRYLESEEIKSIEREKPETGDAIQLIKNAGGIAVLAHPYKIKNIGLRGSEDFKKNFDELIRELKGCGLKGIECIYPEHTHEEELFFIDVAAKYHLHITEGSDFHGDRD